MPASAPDGAMGSSRRLVCWRGCAWLTRPYLAGPLPALEAAAPAERCGTCSQDAGLQLGRRTAGSPGTRAESVERLARRDSTAPAKINPVRPEADRGVPAAEIRIRPSALEGWE